MRILIVEDDIGIAETLEDVLSPTYAVDRTSLGKDAIYRSSIITYDLIILDLGLPDISGHEVCVHIRSEGITTPIIILTGIDALQSKVSALDSGADDYVVKPFTVPELTARIRTQLRRSAVPIVSVSNTLTYQNLSLNCSTRTVTYSGNTIPLRRKEFDLLEYLLRKQGSIVTRTMILDHLWDENGNQFSNIVDVHIKYLRDRIDRPFNTSLIKTVHGLGYTIPAQKP